ncbi:MAG: membrane protein insertion efficiency factor YidD [Candidatus Omnitrophica bacterium]|nr:membrane protein insertion efficiency factor YidD [Candidatus Omnitrophota bacterium]
MIKRPLIALIKFYQGNLRVFFPASCRFFPSCSDYALESLHNYILPKALLKIFFRIIRCNPFFPGGHDPLR